jgi:hypothetical protein
MCKMGLHDPFGHLKHKIWTKERLGVKPNHKKLRIDLIPLLAGACDMPLENFRRGLQLCFRLHPNRRFAHKVRTPQSCGTSNLGDFGTKNHLDEGLAERWRVYYMGEGGGFPWVWPWWVLWVRSRSWFVLTPKVLQHCAYQLVGWFCVGSCEWIIAYHSS